MANKMNKSQSHSVNLTALSVPRVKKAAENFLFHGSDQLTIETDDLKVQDELGKMPSLPRKIMLSPTNSGFLNSNSTTAAHSSHIAVRNKRKGSEMNSISISREILSPLS